MLSLAFQRMQRLARAKKVEQVRQFKAQRQAADNKSAVRDCHRALLCRCASFLSISLDDLVVAGNCLQAHRAATDRLWKMLFLESEEDSQNAWCRCVHNSYVPPRTTAGSLLW